MRKKAFTMAEVLIVLAIVGIIVAICMPIIVSAIPDTEEAKVRKAYNTIVTVVQSLVNDSSIYSDGVLGEDANGSDITDTTYFCQKFADQLNTAGEMKCEEPDKYKYYTSTKYVTYTGKNADEFDDACTKKDADDMAFKTTDGIYWYGMYDTFPEQTTTPDQRYVVICVDPDPSDSDGDTYGFGIRRDGKIAVGANAQAILDKEGLNE